MIKKFLFSIFFIIIFAQITLAQEVRVTSVNFDTSNSLIFLTSPDSTTETIMKNIKLTKLQNPKRVYFDINSAVLATQTQNWYLNSGGINQVKISQFSNNPNKIRVVLYLDEGFDQSKLSFLKVNNNIVIKYKDCICKNTYFQNTYRDEKTLSSDFYDNLSISNIGEKNLTTTLINKDDVLNEIQQAFDTNNQLKNNIKNVADKPNEIIKKELKLKSKYYLNAAYQKPNGFLISGFGTACIEKPMYLTNPARVVFDIPNAIINPEVKNHEIKIGQDIVKIGQFEFNKVRIVITSDQLEKYFPIFSADGQSIMFTNSEKIDFDSLFSKTTDAISYSAKDIDPKNSEFIIDFSYPVVHSIRRDNSKLIINFYNALRYNDKNFRYSIQNTALSEMKMDLLPQVGLKLILPLKKNAIVNCYLGSDGRTVKITVKGLIPKQTTYSAEKPINFSNCKGKKSIVLDPGHGGSDYGAIRGGINEKDINLDVAKRVQAILESSGVSVIMTRERDETVSLEDRTIFCANANPNVFLSVHVNSSIKPEISGIETHYYHDNSLDFAQTVHASLISYVRSLDRGLFKSRFYVINHTIVPAILVEIGFISNDNERAELVSEERKQQTAKAIANGILKYLNKK